MTILRRHFPGYRLNFKPVSCDAEERPPVRRVIGRDQDLSVDLVGGAPSPLSRRRCGLPLPKGSKVFVEGETRHDRYTDKDGQERFFSKVVVATPQHELKSLDRQETPVSEAA